MNTYLIFGLGFFAQFLFFSRTVLQWFKSENEGESISPVVFWKISLFASVMMLLYGIFRNDFSIMLGQAIVYFIYVRNLQLKDAWRSWHPLFRAMTLLTPVGVVIWLVTGNTYNFSSILGNEEIPLWLLIWGIAGQLIFTFRFVYQWIYSEKEQESVLPAAFWIISTIGAVLILIYAVFRLDPVLFISNGLGLFIYIRNILLYRGKRSLVSRIENEKLSHISRKISGKIH